MVDTQISDYKPPSKSAFYFSVEVGENRKGCFLQCKQCQAFIGANKEKQCSRTVCMGLDMCWQHMASLQHLRIKWTTLTGWNPRTRKHNLLKMKGLFAYWPDKEEEVCFKKKEVICSYNGLQIRRKIVDKLYEDGGAPYAICHTPHKEDTRPAVFCIDAACHRGVAAFANHSIDKRKLNAKLKYAGMTPNIPRGSKIKFNLVALRDIKHGEEIFFDYQPSEKFEPKREPNHSTKRIYVPVRQRRD
jgi:hypothetical protein